MRYISSKLLKESQGEHLKIFKYICMDLEFQRINEFYLSLVRSSATFVYTTFFFFFFFILFVNITN